MNRRSVEAKAVLLDIEGTTTPIAFVTEVLFPYARAHLHTYLERHRGEGGLMAALRREHDRCRERQQDPPAWPDSHDEADVASAAVFVEWLMDRDFKSTPLKTLQGLIWKAGYQEGALVGSLFPDVRPALQRWRDDGRTIGIYSSGSVLAQQLLFRHSCGGDLTGLINAYFDTNIGPKTDPESYRAITRALDRPVSEVLFLSDASRELHAARQAGLSVIGVIRPDAPAPWSAPDDFDTISSFDEL